MIHETRIKRLNDAPQRPGMVLYWMSRDQRAGDNWALLFAQKTAIENREPLGVVFCLVPSFLDATMRQYGFMIKGLKAVSKKLRRYSIPFYFLTGRPEQEIPALIKIVKAGTLIGDFSPLRISRVWKKHVAGKIRIPFFEVDAHNIVPCRYASDKQEFAAYTIRSKIQKKLPSYLTEFPEMKKHPHNIQNQSFDIDWEQIEKKLTVDRTVSEISWLSPGEDPASHMLDEFISSRLARYSRSRNDPNEDVQSRLSPYLHFGQISAQRVALAISKLRKNGESREAFLEELIVRRELSENFCHYNQSYDSFEGFPSWAQKTLNLHRKDKREYLYSQKVLEAGNTHDPLWNAAQKEMVITGKMHGYLRMYWAKKILEWSESPEEALKTGIYMNDKYELDGRDPNGYAGLAWSIGGVHDRAWGERPVFGKIRYMSFEGCRRKFNVGNYIEKINSIEKLRG